MIRKKSTSTFILLIVLIFLGAYLYSFSVKKNKSNIQPTDLTNYGKFRSFYNFLNKRVIVKGVAIYTKGSSGFPIVAFMNNGLKHKLFVQDFTKWPQNVYGKIVKLKGIISENDLDQYNGDLYGIRDVSWEFMDSDESVEIPAWVFHFCPHLEAANSGPGQSDNTPPAHPKSNSSKSR